MCIINNDVNYIDWNLDLDNDVEGFLVEACSDSPEVMLSGSQMAHLAIVFLDCCTQVAMLQKIVTLFFPCFRSYVYGRRHGLN